VTTPASTKTHAANRARQQRTAESLERIEQALTRMSRDGAPITYLAVARRARVSRTFLYQNIQAKALMATAISQAGNRQHELQASKDAELEASWKERALNAEDALRIAHAEIRTQRDRIAVLMGRIRDLESDYSEESAQRLAAENTALKQRARHLAQENRALEDKLQAARSNNRFLDKRIANLEVELAAPASGP
jgi:chromosome segregation ATPase